MTKEIVTLNVEGMSCSHCVNSIKKSVGALRGVMDVTVDLNGKKVTVGFDPVLVKPEVIKETIEDQGYEIKDK